MGTVDDFQIGTVSMHCKAMTLLTFNSQGRDFQVLLCSGVSSQFWRGWERFLYLFALIKFQSSCRVG